MGALIEANHVKLYMELAALAVFVSMSILAPPTPCWQALRRLSPAMAKREGYLFLDFFLFLFWFFVFRGFWLLASVASGFCGFWLLWLLAFVAFGFRGFRGFCGFWLLWLLAFWPIHLSVYTYPFIYLSIFLSFYWQLFSFLFLYLLFLLFSLQRRNQTRKQASKQARAAHLWIWCAAGGGAAPPQTPPRATKSALNPRRPRLPRNQ